MGKIKSKTYQRKGKEILITNPVKEDAEELLGFMKKVSGETDFLLREQDEINMTVKEEKEFLENMKTAENNLFIVAKVDNKIAGNLGFTGSQLRRYSHQGEFGMSVLEEYWGMGIGSLLIETLMNWAKKNGIVRISLRVAENNTRARGLYEKYDFQKEGILRKKKVLSDGSYCNEIVMAKIH